MRTGSAGDERSTTVVGLDRPSPLRRGLAQARQRLPNNAMPEWAVLVVVLLLMGGFFSTRSQYFFAGGNMVSILEAVAVTGLIAVPATLLMIAGQFDLSVGSATALSGVVLATVATSQGIVVGIVAALVVGLLVGLTNGVLVTVVKVNALIATIGMLAVLRGLSRLTSDGQSISMSNFSYLGTGRPFLGLPVPVLLFVSVVLIAALAMRFTVFGRSLYAIGANAVAARLVGIPPRKIVLIAFVASGIATGVAGAIVTSQLGAASPNAGLGLELSVVTAVILGGASLHGGKGTIVGTLIGLLVVAVLNNGLVLLGVSSYVQEVARGGLLILAVSFDQIRQRL